MKMIGGKQRLCISGWVLAALVIAALNVNAWIALESRPLEGNPTVIRALRQKIAWLERVLDFEALERFGRDGAVDLPVALRKLPAAEEGARAPSSVPVPAPAAAPEKIVLPVLSGVVRIADPLLTPYFLAVLDGRVYREHEYVKAYQIAEISSRGVVLRREGAFWHIENPVPYYSSDGGH